MQAPITYLAFKTQTKDALAFYMTVFPDTKVLSVTPYPDRPEVVLNSQLEMHGIV